MAIEQKQLYFSSFSKGTSNVSGGSTAFTGQVFPEAIKSVFASLQ